MSLVACVYLLLGFLLLGSGAIDAASALRLADLFSDHMVLQRHSPIRIWGHAAAGAQVSASLTTAAGTTAQTDETGQTAIADGNGRWQLELLPRPAGGPHRLIVRSGSEEVAMEDVLIGEVWIASGQSNMQWSLSASASAEEAIASANLSRIRLLTIPNVVAFQPSTTIDARWSVCTPETARSFSAVAYFFGRQLHAELDVPIGLINTSWSGTRIEPWTAAQHIHGLISRLPEPAAQVVKQAVSRRQAFGPDPHLIQQQYMKSVATLKEAEATGSTEFAEPTVNDREWLEMTVPSTWEAGGLPDFDGMVWFRRHLQIPGQWQGKDLVLHLGPVDEVDVTWFNGVRIGATGSYADSVFALWSQPRVYDIPGEIVRSGSAVLAVRAIDTAYAGGLWGSEADQMYLALADGSGDHLLVSGNWKYRAGPQLSISSSGSQQLPSTLYNAMIHPLVPFSLRGAIWYQGESNVNEGSVYTEKMIALIDSWRDVFGQGDLPFYFVQLAPFRYGNDPTLLPRLWEAQTQVPARRSNVANIAINDVGNVDDIHPRDKQTVGSRLANLALRRTYRLDGIWDQGPRFVSMQRQGNTLRLLFDYAQGLITRDGRMATGFEIAAEDGIFVTATAIIDGEHINLSHSDLAQPRMARFAWHQEASPNLINGGGLPATPFRAQTATLSHP
jgi:sialate O-acetylesterase